MKAFLTGGTGFLGGRLARLLRSEGHEVVALAREGSKSGMLREMGAQLATGDVTLRESLQDPMRGADAVFHVAAWYELGVSDVALMEKINVEGTRNVLESAAEAGVPTIVHCSSVAALGFTGGKLVDETHKHDGYFGSTYDRTKHESHKIAQRLAQEGAPVRIGLPGTIFGPGDASLVSWLLRAHLRRQLLAQAFTDLSMSLVFVDDCARGLKLIAEQGRAGGEYNLVGEVIRLGEWIRRMSAITGIAPPRLTVPTGLLRFGANFFPLVAGRLKMAPGTAREGLAMAEGASWMFSSERARRELGWQPRDFDEALALTLVAFDRNRGRGFRPRTEGAAQALEKIQSERAAA